MPVCPYARMPVCPYRVIPAPACYVCPVMRRGRPPYPDLLTPREQEVLELLRQGLTNQQIAGRLGISLPGARYHVSEILSKLGVSTREDAAAWQPEAPTPRLRLPALLALPLHKLAGMSAFKVFAVGTIGAAGIALGLLALAVIAFSTHEETGPPGALGKLAFVQDGNLWVKTLPDGQPVQVTNDGEASYPRWSLSGQWISAGGEMVRADGGERRDAPICGIWSPVADKIICAIRDGDSFTAFRIEAPDGTLLTEIDLRSLVMGKHPDLDVDQATCPAWSPDGTRLACIVTASRAPPDTLSGNVAAAYSRYSGLWVVLADGSDTWDVVDNFELVDDYGAVGIVGWTADGSSVLFQIASGFSASIQSDGLRLYSAPVDGGEMTRIEGTLLPRDELQDWHDAETMLAVTEGGWRETWTNKRIAMVNLDTGSLNYLTAPDEAAVSPALSPDGTTIAYVSGPDIGKVGGGDTAREGAALRRIWLMDADGTDKRQLTDDSAYRDERPLWSPEGKHILFARIDVEDQATLWLVPATGGEAQRMATISGPQVSDQAPLWFGYYGYIAWNAYYDWWQP